MAFQIIGFLTVSVLIGLAFYAYQPSREDLRKAFKACYRELKHICGNVSRRGPRPALMWAVIYIFAAIGYRVWTNTDLPDAATLASLLGSATVAGGALAFFRSQDYRNGVANNEPLVNPEALR